MRSLLIAGACMLAILVVAAAPAAAASNNAVYTDGNGAALADFAWNGSCEGLGTITVTIHRPTGDEVKTASAKSIMEPNLCTIGCLDCPVPFTWTLIGTGVDITGGGMAGLGAAWSVQGSFSGGVVEVHSTVALCVDDVC